MMRGWLLALALLAVAGSAVADTWVDGYTRDDGTYVEGHMRSDPDDSYNNNWSVEGNTNPYTGEPGTRSRTLNDQTPDSNRKQFGDPLYENKTFGVD